MFTRSARQATKPALGPGRDGLITEASSYRKRGKSERNMAEIRRMLLEKIQVRMKAEGLHRASSKDDNFET
jgi:hypothetical protein